VARRRKEIQGGKDRKRVRIGNRQADAAADEISQPALEKEIPSGTIGLRSNANKITMKSSYELAMERLNKVSPASKLTEAQKKQLAELDSKYAAKIAGREIALQDEIAKAEAAENLEKADTLRQQLVGERKSLLAELEGKKEKVRS
jgi:hypothetical protein